MTPPDQEAVEAAIKWARDCAVTDKEMRILGADDPYSYGTDTAARILADEVERLRGELEKRDAAQPMFPGGTCNGTLGPED